MAAFIGEIVMKRVIIVISIVAVLAGVITAYLIFRPSKTAQIAILETNWSGEKDYVPTEQATTYRVKSGDVIRCGGIVDFEVTVSKISNDSVTIKTNTPMSSIEEPYVDLDADETRFTLPNDKSLRLVTPTLDAGDIYIFSILKIDEEK